GLRAGRRLVIDQAVVAQRALLGHAQVGDLGLLPFPLPALGLRGGRPVGTALDDAERAARHAGAAPVAHVGLDDDGTELGPEQRAGRAHVEASGVRAVLSDV